MFNPNQYQENIHGVDDIIPPKIDFVFKELMFKEKIRKGFLGAVLNIPPENIVKADIINTNLQKVHPDKKQGILDVRVVIRTINSDGVKNKKDKEIDIEIQLAPISSWADRSVFYLSRMMAEQTSVDKIYSNLKKCIGINILNFNYLKNENHFHNVFHIANDISHNIYTDIMEWHIIELPKLPSSEDGTSLYNWTKFINSENREELKQIADKDEYLREAYMELETISQDKAARVAYNSYLKAVMDENTMKEEAEIKGREIAFKEISDKMRSLGYSEDKIREIIDGNKTTSLFDD